MFNKKNLTKISLFIGLFSVALYMSYAFGLSWRGSDIVTNTINIDISILNPIKTQIMNLLGNDYGLMLFNIICLNIGWYFFVVFPVWLCNIIKEVIYRD